MVRKIIYFSLIFLLLFSLPSVLALDAFHEAWHYPGETFTINGKLYSISQGSDCHQINFGREGEYFILNEFDCEETMDKVERFCFLKSACPDDDDHIRYEAGNIIYGAKIALYDLVPKISLENSPSTTVVRVGDELKFTTTIENEGEMAISDGVFKVRIPDGFDLIDRPLSSSYKNRVLSKSFSLGPGVKDIFRYKLKVKDYVSENIVANASYYYNNELYEYSSNKVTINVPSPYLISRTLSKKKVGVNEESLYEFTFQNNDGQEDIDLEVRLEGADDLKVVYPDEFKEGVLKKTFSPGEKKVYTLRLSSLKTVDTNLKLVFDIFLNGEHILKTFQNPFICELSPAKPTILVNPEVNEGSEYSVRVTIRNPSSLNNYYNVKGYLINQQTKEKHTFESELIGKNHEDLVLDFSTIAPEVDQETTQEYLLKGSYESVSGQKFEFSKTKKLKILDKKEPFIVTRTLNDTSLKASDLVEVTVKIKNQLGEYSPLIVNDVLPDSVFVKAGLRSNEMSVDVGEEKQAYIYKLLIPETYPDNKLVIITKIYNKNTGEVYEFKNTYDVESNVPVIKKEDNSTVVQENSSDKQEIIVRRKKTGFFQKIINAISNFFEDLFD